MQRGEWSRSRYWLCRFLHSRHLRDRIDWDAGGSAAAHAAASELLESLPRRDEHDYAWLVGRSLRWERSDPAFVQSLRLFVKELRFQQGLLSRLGRGSAARQRSPLPVRMWAGIRRALGLRFEMSCLLMGQLVRQRLSRQLAASSPDAALAGVCQQIQRDCDAHIAFLSERLTREYADFNFIRRNARRLRLRVMCLVELHRARRAARRAGLPSAFTPTDAADCRHQFEAVLERMVPYHRDALLAALLEQTREPYAEPRVIGAAPASR